jgi:hypothetical protein
LVCKWRATIHDAIDGLTRRTSAVEQQRAYLDAVPQEGHASCIATLVLGRKSQAYMKNANLNCQVAENLQTWYLKATRGSVLNREVLSPQDPNLEFSK